MFWSLGFGLKQVFIFHGRGRARLAIFTGGYKCLSESLILDDKERAGLICRIE